MVSKKENLREHMGQRQTAQREHKVPWKTGNNLNTLNKKASK